MMSVENARANTERCLVAHGAHARTDRDWWPGNLRLDGLSQHAPSLSPARGRSSDRPPLTYPYPDGGLPPGHAAFAGADRERDRRGERRPIVSRRDRGVARPGRGRLARTPPAGSG
jgi:hypothetical protein